MPEQSVSPPPRRVIRVLVRDRLFKDFLVLLVGLNHNIAKRIAVEPPGGMDLYAVKLK